MNKISLWGVLYPQKLRTNRIFSIMKITLLLNFVFVFGLFAGNTYSQNAKVTLSRKSSPLEVILNEIENQTDYLFVINSQVNIQQKISVEVKEKPVSKVLDEIFAGTDVHYVMEGTHIVLSNKNMSQNSVDQQIRTITGKITDEMGEPLIGVSISVKGTESGTITNTKGEFSVSGNFNNKTVLIISYIGMKKQEIEIGSRSYINITMVSDSEFLDEVVVVGYGTQRKRDLTGAIASVNAEKIAEQATTNAIQSLQGKIAGVNIVQDSWNPGASGSIQIRGRRSLSASNDPLYVVDGIPIERGINEINPSEIESIEVLKDASATAIYGSRGANGVVLITTKRGKAGKTRVEYDGYYGIQKPLRELDIMNGAEFAEFVREAYRNRPSNQYGSAAPDKTEDQNNGIFGKDPYVMESVMMGYDENGNYNPANVRSFDWIDAVMRTGSIQNHQLTVTGGSEKTKLMFSGAYFSNEGIMKDKDYERFSIRTNVDHEVNSFLTLGTSTMYSRIIENGSGNLYERARNISPLASPYNEDGSLTMFPGGDGLAINPVAEITGRQTENRRNRLLSNVYAEVKLPLSFKYRFNFGLDHRTARDGRFRSSMALGGSLPEAEYGGNSLDLYTFNNILYYDNVFKDKHRLNVTLLQEAQDFHFEEHNINVKGLPAEYQEYFNVGAASEVRGVRSRLTTWYRLWDVLITL